jgi:hypothetical protein
MNFSLWKSNDSVSIKVDTPQSPLHSPTKESIKLDKCSVISHGTNDVVLRLQFLEPIPEEEENVLLEDDKDDFYNERSCYLGKIILTPIRYCSATKNSLKNVKKYEKELNKIKWQDSRHGNAKVGDYFGFVIDDKIIKIFKIVDKRINTLTLSENIYAEKDWVTFLKINKKGWFNRSGREMKDNWKIIETVRTDYWLY